MYAQSFTRRVQPLRLAVVLGVMGVLLLAVITIETTSSSAKDATILATGPKPVSGYVYMADGTTPAVGATVIVTVWNLTSLRSTLTETTDSTGFYMVTFAPNEWDVGNLIVAGATLGSDFGESNAVADNSAAQYVNVVLGTAIPEFSIPIVAVIAIGGIVLMGARGSSRRR